MTIIISLTKAPCGAKIFIIETVPRKVLEIRVESLKKYSTNKTLGGKIQ